MNTKNVLCWKKSYQLNKWIEDNKKTAETNTDIILAKMATKQLAFQVTQFNIKSARITTEIHYNKIITQKNYGGEASKQTRRYLRTLARHALCIQEGRIPPQSLIDALERIADRHIDEDDL